MGKHMVPVGLVRQRALVVLRGVGERPVGGGTATAWMEESVERLDWECRVGGRALEDEGSLMRRTAGAVVLRK